MPVSNKNSPRKAGSFAATNDEPFWLDYSVTQDLRTNSINCKAKNSRNRDFS